jgi:hypothetical protein
MMDNSTEELLYWISWVESTREFEGATASCQYGRRSISRGSGREGVRCVGVGLRCRGILENAECDKEGVRIALL